MLSCTLMQGQQATVKLDASTPHQRITGFGGFVCSPQFTYNHMSTTEIKKVWGASSTVGCNIMRLYIPIGKNAWSQSLQTAKLAKQMGLIVFASPWGQPAEWKTNGTSNAQNSDGKQGKLKPEKWPDYAQYLEDYVQYLRKNGVELDAISIQNEPDWAATYAGCLWSASEIASFVKTYGRSISCKIMAPESIGCSDSYVNALNKSNVLDCFDIYGGHQYGGIQSAYKNLAKKGKEIWMTEYLINWNEGQANGRNFDFSKDFFNFFRSINTCMLGDFNAWIHYAAKRYYAMMGDGTQGAGSSGTITKRGYIMAQFAKFVTGMTRIDATFSGASLEGSAYLSQSGDSAAVVIANTGNEDVELTVDLPFYTTGATVVYTSKTKNFTTTTQSGLEETFRPVVTIPAQSVSTVFTIRSRDRQPSDMTGSMAHFDLIDSLKTTKSTFGTNYQLSGKTKTFDSSNPLISNRKNTSSGYVELNDRYSQLVMHIKKVTTTSALTAGATKLIYVNAKGNVSTHEYGRLDLGMAENFDLIFDLSPATLTDGCFGLLSLTCDNTQSHLSITFGDVYFGNDYSGTLTGAYVADDSNVMDYTSDPACTSLDMTAVTDLPDALPWLTGNRVVYVADGSPVSNLPNVVAGGTCKQLVLSEDGGDFRPRTPFMADAATLTCNVDGARLLMLPFHANIPDGARAYFIGDDLALQQMRSIPAHIPILIEGNGELTFTGTGDVAFTTSPLTDRFRGTYTATMTYPGDYTLGQQGGKWGFVRQTATAPLMPFGVYIQPDSSESFIAIGGFSGTGISEANENETMRNGDNEKRGGVYNLYGQRVKPTHRGIVVSNGHKYLRR